MKTRLLDERLELAMRARRRGGRAIAVLAVEAHAKGSSRAPLDARVLEAPVEARVRGVVEAVDTVEHAGGLRFHVLLERAEGGAFAVHVADALVREMRRPFHVGGRAIPLVASVGVAVFPDDGEDAASLLRRAEGALEGARVGGGEMVGFCSGSETAHRRLAVERALVGVEDRDELSLHYQPQIDVEESQLVGVEALLRWNHPQLGRVSPAEMIPLLEVSGGIERVGRWALEEACRQAAAWRAAGAPLRVSVNVSARQLEAGGFDALVARVLERHALPPELLELELTESVLVDDVSSTRATLEALRRRGVRVAVDDFGTGYASLAYVRRFPMDVLKIDRMFVRGISEDAGAEAITAAILALARGLGMETVAEGVETDAEQEAVRRLGGSVVQGYLHAQPMPAAALDAWRAARPWL